MISADILVNKFPKYEFIKPEKIIKMPAENSEIATKEDKCGLKPKYFINVAGGKGNLS